MTSGLLSTSVKEVFAEKSGALRNLYRHVNGVGVSCGRIYFNGLHSREHIFLFSFVVFKAFIKNLHQIIIFCA